MSADQPSTSPTPPQTAPLPSVAPHEEPTIHKSRWKLWVGIALAIVVLIALIPWVHKILNTVSTDDAYVNGHVTFVAPRVSGQVIRVFVDDNNRVHRGDLLVQLDKEPMQVQVSIAQTALNAAQSNLKLVQAQTRGLESQIRGLRFGLQHTIEDVNNQVALLRSKVAIVDSQRATLNKAQSDYNDALPLVQNGAVTREEVDRRKESFLIAQAGLEEALEGVYQIRVSLGLPPKPETGDDLSQVPPNLNQSFSSVRQAQANLMQSAAQLGIVIPFDQSPEQMISDFYKRDPQGDIDKIYDHLAKEAPAVKEAEAKADQAKADLDQANLNLRYCDVISEIDGVVTRRDVNRGNNVVAGQSLMAVRSLSEVWIDANFKETQLSSLRIGQSADLDVDMYGSRHHFKGRISGFEMGTGSTLALLPAENATGNFVKVVQRLPVRIDLVDYDPDKIPLFVGTSVSPTVFINEDATGADAGKVLQPYIASSMEPTTSPTMAPTTTAASNAAGTP